ncbi:hypothetical protein INT48_007452 [Thamnidium elegans]|uniref:HMG box domain-containing protein n=1 Tax=Thamnidium elegans TaxID=101142 RepID=A0A8H7VVY3_9FUNG|nr:hypothetical protein INT48_007452 [Thamnidium elegans]
MKNSLYSNSTPFIRQLKPKVSFPKKTLRIQNLSFSSDLEGKTLIKIYPSQVLITSKELIEMIEEKRESIQVENSTCVLRENILVAIHNFACEEDTSVPIIQGSVLSNVSPNVEARRPTNAFILYRTALRKKIKSLFPSFSNSDISKFTGAMWKAADKEVKDKYVKQAMECRILHKQMYPDFEYNAKKERSEKAVTDGEDYSFLNDNWDEYFSWCIQNATTGIVTEEAHTLDGTNLIEGPFALESLLGEGYHESNEWREVCNMVNQFFPEDSDQNTVIDDKLWVNIGGTELFNTEDISSASYFELNQLGPFELR